jgi:hypothetical protein
VFNTSFLGAAWLVAVAAVSGCADAVDGQAPAGPSDGSACAGSSLFVSEVVHVAYGAGQDFGRGEMPEIVYGPPRGGGCCQGSLDVVSLGNGGEIVVGFGETVIVDRDGPDFVVFENAFEKKGGGVFAELATVSASEDGETWRSWPCAAKEPPFGACAGAAPVYLDADDPWPLDPAVAGGDAFDLVDVGLAQARFVRIVDRPDLDGLDGVFDLDAVGILHAACP